jgi:alkaline phosphatase D
MPLSNKKLYTNVISVMLDTRNYDRSITTLNWNDDYVAELIDDAGRSLMGSAQENWFYRSLSESKERGATWRIIGNQIIFSRINNTAVYGEALNADQWDGKHFSFNPTSRPSYLLSFPPPSIPPFLHPPLYLKTPLTYPTPPGYTSNRNRTLSHLYTHSIPNTAFLAGDSHANWVSDLVWLDQKPYDPVTGVGAIGVEFAGTAVSSTGYGSGRSIANSSDRSAALVRDNPELQWTEGYYRGYYELVVGAEELVARYYGKLDLSILFIFTSTSLAHPPVE